MDNHIISIFNNKIFLEIINEIKSFSKFTAKYYEDLDLCIADSKKLNQITIFFESTLNKDFVNKIKLCDIPLILISKNLSLKKNISGELKEHLKMPFTILDFEKKITSLFAKSEFKKNSLINLNGYTIDKNERKIKKNNLELQLSEKEINFLVLFSINNKPISRNDVLKNVWNYSSESETHTVETHIHRLRKKILEKFGDNNFIKNNNKGYYI